MRRYLASFPDSVPTWMYGVLLAGAILWPFGVANFWVFLGAAACLYAIAALGLTVLVGWAGEVSLAHAGLVGTSVYIAGFAVRDDGLNWPYWAAIILGIAAAVALSFLVSLPTSRMSGIYVMILTLGLQVTIERTVFTYPSLTGGPDAVSVARPQLLSISFESDRAYYYFALVALAVVLVCLTLFRSSRHGRAMMLVKTDRRAAQAVGIAPWRYKILAFAMAGALAGLAGSLTPALYRSPPTLLQYLAIPSLLYLAVPVTAGFESLLAVVVVAFAFQMIPQALESLHLSPFVVGGVALLAGTFVGSRGLGGVALDALRRRRAPHPAAATPLSTGAVRSGPARLVVAPPIDPPAPAQRNGTRPRHVPHLNGNGASATNGVIPSGRPRRSVLPSPEDPGVDGRPPIRLRPR